MIAIVAGISAYIVQVEILSNMSMEPEKANPFVVYIHSNLSINMDGKPVIVPRMIGIDESLWKNHSLDKYGYPGMPMDKEGKTTMPGMAPLYTNNEGQITVGSIVNRNYSLDDFLNIWGALDLKEKTVNATVNGKPVSDNREIILKDNQQINLNVSSSK
jgi:hypothetical protein